MLFLTDIDPNAKVKGARDPLGTQSIWTGFTRRIIGNLTSQTVTLDDFRVLVIGAWIEDQLTGDEVRRGDAFLVWEQLAAYARLEVADQTGFRGVTRAKSFLRQGTVVVSPERVHQLLTNQSAYGIWGLYRAAAGRCGLLNDEAPAVRGDVAALVKDVYLAKLSAAWGADARELLRWCAKGHELSPRRHRDKLEAVAACIDGPLEPRERDLYRDLVLFGGAETRDFDVPLYQAELAQALPRQVPPDRSPRREDVLALVPETSSVLSRRLEDISACEALLAPSMRCFSFVSKQSGQSVEAVVDQLAEHFRDAPTLLTSSSLERLRSLRAHEPSLLRAPEEKVATQSRWLSIAEALHAKEFGHLVALLLEQNTAVSRDRGGSVGWVSVTDQGLLDVHLADPGGDLPAAETVTEQWVNGYFLSNLRAMATPILEEPA